VLVVVVVVILVVVQTLVVTLTLLALEPLKAVVGLQVRVAQ
jgi:hypothetical protein